MNTEALPFDQNRLLNHLMQVMGAKNDAALSRELEVAPPVISKMRHHRLAVGPALKIRIMEKTHITLRDLNYLIGKVAA
jgi:hypothetical protein